MIKSTIGPKKLAKALKPWMKPDVGLDTLLEVLLTSGELTDLTDRISILKDLHAGKTQRFIAQKHNVSISKVIRGAAVYKKHYKFLGKVFL